MLHLFQAGPGPEQPAYHVLIIGISRYDHLRGGDGVLATEPLAEGLEQLAAAATSAVRVALWFRDHFDSPGAARGSIRLLVPPALDELPLPKGVTADPATYENVREAVVAWRRDLRTHSGNVAVLYVAGHGMQTSAEGGIVLLQDFGSPDSLTPLERAIDVAAVRRGIVADPNQPDTATPQLQFYFYDACRITSPAAAGYASLAAGIALDEPRGTPPRASWVSFGSRPQDYALAVVATRTTLYSQAFLDCLDRRARPDDEGHRPVRGAAVRARGSGQRTRGPVRRAAGRGARRIRKHRGAGPSEATPAAPANPWRPGWSSPRGYCSPRPACAGFRTRRGRRAGCRV